MRRTMICLFLLACCSSLLAMDVFPPAPDSHTFVKVLTRQSPYCALTRTDVAVEASTVTVTAIPDNSRVCPAIFFPLQADIGAIPPGVWSVVFKTAGGAEFDHATLIIRDAGTGIIVSPVGSRPEGGRTVQVFGAQIGDDATPTVLFDGVAATNVQVQNRALVVTPPAHAVGTVDVTVTDSTGTRKAVAAFTYFDPAAAPDPFVFEPLLYPVAYDGPGVFGSQWTTNNVLATGRTLARFRDLVGARTCTATCSQFDWSAVLSPESQSGLLLWAVRRRLPLGVEDDLQVSSRIVDTSQSHGNGTGLPVAREHDFRNDFSIQDVPVGGTARVLLRLYSPDPTAADVHVTVRVAEGAPIERDVVLRRVNGVAYASVDLGGSAGSRTAPGAVTVTSANGAKIWGLITVTDNATQEVTAFWPQ